MFMGIDAKAGEAHSKVGKAEGKFVEQENSSESSSRYIVQKKVCLDPPPLSHPPISDIFATTSTFASPFPPLSSKPTSSFTATTLAAVRFHAPDLDSPTLAAQPSPSYFLDNKFPYHADTRMSAGGSSYPYSRGPPEYKHQPEFLQDIPIKIWMQPDPSKNTHMPFD